MTIASSHEAYNVYCDESCHLLNDGLGVMVLGAGWCPRSKVRSISTRLKEIKASHGLPASFDAKWTKVSPSQEQFYLDMIDYFFDDDDLHFRTLIVPDKSLLRHEEFNQDHDTWYYKMYFQLLTNVIRADRRFKIYLDIKDTRSSRKIQKLSQVLANSRYDFSMEIIERMQAIRSEESQVLQLVDLLIGAVSSVNRDIPRSATKQRLIERVQQRSGKKLTMTTLMSEEKFNIFRWTARSRG